MKKIAKLSKEDRIVLFTRTGEKMNMHPAIVEKDFWVCFIHVIDRFSEDIDLILDWRKLTGKTNPWEERSKTKQDAESIRVLTKFCPAWNSYKKMSTASPRNTEFL